jgi:amino acid adenylation domain-containing protein
MSSPVETCIHQLVEAQARRKPDSVAVVFGSQTLTYGELDRRANRIAHYLLSRGAGTGSFVGLLVERSPEMLVGLLGILKAGSAYLPLDPVLPPGRMALMLEDSQAAILLTEQHLADRLPDYAGTTVSVDAEQSAIARQPTTSPSAAISPESLAYVIYTSGSTGRPKGVRIAHRNVINLLADMRTRLEMTDRDVLLAVTTLSFDIAGLELWLPLITGARVAIATRDTAADGAPLAEEVERTTATILQATPVTWQLLLDAGWEGSSRLTALCGGEALTWELASRLQPKVRRLWNVYGPTETTIWSTAFRVTASDVVRRESRVVPLGYAVANTSLYVLDERRRPVSAGVPGELYIGGAGVGCGYLNRPDLTAERFVTLHLGDGAEQRLYRTGDRVRWRDTDGALEFLGRTDDQVKLRGFRIELGEVEAALASHPAVKEAAAVVHEFGVGDRRLIAYVVLRPDTETPPGPDALRSMLTAQLPAYMVPSAIMELRALPRMTNGKLDRRSLPAPATLAADTGSRMVAPRGALESLLQDIWQRALNISPIGVTDDFFDLGGHSLLAGQIFSEIRRRLGRTLPLVALIRAPTIEQLAEALSRDEPLEAAGSPLVPVRRHASDATPIFLIHGLTGEVMNLHPLALRLAADFPVYAVQARSVDDAELPPLECVEDMAAFYIENIRRVQPHGPYRLAGFCFGGLVAFEMARKLSDDSETVSFLGLLDSNFHQQYLPPLSRMKYELNKHRIHAETVCRLPLRDGLAYVGDKVRRRLRRSSRPAGAADPHPSGPESTDGRNVAGEDAPAEPHAVTAAATRAFLAYKPGKYAGRLTYFRPEQRDLRNIMDFASEWHGRVNGHAETVYVPGDHMTMLEAPAVEVLAEHMRARLVGEGS